MKIRNFFTAAAVVLLAGCGTTYQATDSGVMVVPDGTKRVFTDQYPNSQNASWSYYSPNVVVLNDWEMTGWQALDEKDYVVYFDMDNENYYAWYDRNGNWVGSATMVKDFNSLPGVVSNAVTSKYPKHTISGVNREYYKDRMLYEISLKHNDSKTVLLVDTNGTIVKEKVKY